MLKRFIRTVSALVPDRRDIKTLSKAHLQREQDLTDRERIVSGGPGSGELALIAGWFSYRNACATFGDTEAMHAVAGWLAEAGVPFEIACDPVNGEDGLDIDSLEPSRYSLFIFVCGPWKPVDRKLLDRFSHCRKIGVNLTLESPTHLDHGFDYLLARDMPGQQRADIVFSRSLPELPLVGIVQVHPQKMYGDRQRHARIAAAIDDYIQRRRIVAINLDTLHLDNPVGIGSAIEYENIVSRLDAVITTRLHGLVFALKKGVPAVAIDAIAGGAKLTAQAQALDWPVILDGDTVDADAIDTAVLRCLESGMHDALERSLTTARLQTRATHDEFIGILSNPKAL